MHDVRSTFHRSSSNLPHCLMAKAYAKDWGDRIGSGQRPFQKSNADSGLVRCTGTRRKENPIGSHGQNIFDSYLVIALHLDVSSPLAQVLDQVVGEGIVVVDDENHPMSLSRTSHLGHNSLTMSPSSVAKLLWTLVVAVPALVAQHLSPEATVNAFVEAWNARQFSKAATMVVGGKPSMSFAGLEVVSPVGTKIELSSLKVTVIGSKATANYKVKFHAPNRPAIERSEKLELTKAGEDWLIVPSTKEGSRNEILGSMAMLTMTDLTQVFQNAKKAAKKTVCLSNIKQLAMAVLMYLTDHNDVYGFNSSKLKATFFPYTKNDKLWLCPDGSKTAAAYSFNANLLNKSVTVIKDPANTVMLYEGSKGLLDFRHGGYAAVAFADGHAKMINAEAAMKLRWKP